MPRKITENLIQKIYRPRDAQSHKGDFGKTCIVAGSIGKMGAAVLATRAALRSGSGISFCLAPDCGCEILQNSCPEAMFLSGGEKFIEKIEANPDYTFGIGPGIGTEKKTAAALVKFLENWDKPAVLDADALNILSEGSGRLRLIPKNSVITPHPREFDRLFGTDSENARFEMALKKSNDLETFIVLKGHQTHIFCPGEQVFINSTGNAGMAKGGSGDVLTGIITALLAQNYAPQDAAVLGVWLHGSAGDLAAEKFSMEAMLPTDLISEIGNVFKNISHPKHK